MAKGKGGLMYCVKTTHKKIGSSWIEAITPQKHVADGWAKKVPSHLSAKVCNFGASDFPVYIIEKTGRSTKGYLKSTFRFAGRDAAVIRFLRSIKLTKKFNEEDYACAILYKVTEPYFSPSAGLDYMGVLDHQHVSKEVVEMFRENGLGALFMDEDEKRRFME